MDLVLPCESWKRSLDTPLRWSHYTATSTEFVGPDGCNGDTMLLPEHAAIFASFVRLARDRHPEKAGHDRVYPEVPADITGKHWVGTRFTENIRCRADR
ncbi:MAG: hypothetical protein ACRESR_03350 [Gammaproteobacteria bacterium]